MKVSTILLSRWFNLDHKLSFFFPLNPLALLFLLFQFVIHLSRQIYLV